MFSFSRLKKKKNFKNSCRETSHYYSKPSHMAEEFSSPYQHKKLRTFFLFFKWTQSSWFLWFLQRKGNIKIKMNQERRNKKSSRNKLFPSHLQFVSTIEARMSQTQFKIYSIYEWNLIIKQEATCTSQSFNIFF